MMNPTSPCNPTAAPQRVRHLCAQNVRVQEIGPAGQGHRRVGSAGDAQAPGAGPKRVVPCLYGVCGAV